MTSSHSIYLKAKKILIITSSGGGGLLQAAHAKKQEIQIKNPNVRFICRDVLKDWVWKWLGAFSIKMWNGSQRKGNVAALKLFGFSMVLTDFLFAPPVFFWTLYTLFKEEIDHVIDTQPLCTSAILKAIRLYKWKTKKRVILEKVLVDFPTKKATHFFRPIRRLGAKDRGYIRITTIAPFLEKGETAQEFWNKNCRLPEDQIQYEPFFVRQSFCKLHKKPKHDGVISIKAAIKNSEEWQLIKKCIDRGCLETHFLDNEIELVIPPQDLVFTILLGSQPAFEGSLNYVRKFLEIAKETEGSRGPLHLFIFCANHRPKESSLLKSVSNLVARYKNYPSSFTVIPLSFQQDDVIAPIFHRSDITCTRSGGQTLMELICVSPKEIWIHSEAKKKGILTREDLLNGIAGWESANAEYMEKLFGAKIVTPETFAPHAEKIIFNKI